MFRTIRRHTEAPARGGSSPLQPAPRVGAARAAFASSRPAVTLAVHPRLVLRVLLALFALAAADALFQPSAPLRARVEGGSGGAVAHAEEQQRLAPRTTTSPVLALAPTQANAPSSSTPASEVSVLDSLSASIGARPTDATAAGQPAGPPVGGGTRVWEGTAARGAYVRRAPERAGAPVRLLTAGETIEVARWVAGEEVEPNNTTWAELADGTFVFSTLLRRAPLAEPPARPTDAPATGRWIDVNLTEQVATAYDGATAVRMALISTGRPGWDTPTGTFSIGRRAEKDTMDGSTLVGQGPNGQGATYKIENVRYVQYFTSDGAAIHENTWRQAGTFGMPGSHGCIGMTSADAAFFWSFATHGTPVVIHE